MVAAAASGSSSSNARVEMSWQLLPLCSFFTTSAAWLLTIMWMALQQSKFKADAHLVAQPHCLAAAVPPIECR